MPAAAVKPQQPVPARVHPPCDRLGALVKASSSDRGIATWSSVEPMTVQCETDRKSGGHRPFNGQTQAAVVVNTWRSSLGFFGPSACSAFAMRHSGLDGSDEPAVIASPLRICREAVASVLRVPVCNGFVSMPAPLSRLFGRFLQSAKMAIIGANRNLGQTVPDSTGTALDLRRYGSCSSQSFRRSCAARRLWQ